MVAIAMGLFAVAWYYIVFDSTKVHPRIAATEKEYILSKINSTTAKERVNFLQHRM